MSCIYACIFIYIKWESEETNETVYLNEMPLKAIEFLITQVVMYEAL